jgi:hypothetical protein
VSHRIFERTLRPVVFRRAYLFERHFNPQALLGVGPCPLRPALKSVAAPSGSKRSNALALGSRGGLPEPPTPMVDLGSGRDTR